MQPPLDEPLLPQTLTIEPASDAAIANTVSPLPARERRNLMVLIAHQVIWRIGWTFKTESIIIPAFLDRVAGAGWIRGCLPLVRNIGQSVPPLFSAEMLRRIGQKKWALAGSAVAAGIPYLVLAGIWSGFDGVKSPAMAATFLALYFLFFVCYGIYQLSSATVQGKLIRPTRRGQLLWGATFLGLFPTIVLCLLFMPGWLESPEQGYTYLFASVGALLAVAGLTTCLLVERGNKPGITREAGRLSLRDTLRPLRYDANLRRLVVVIFLFFIGVVTIPHYQTFARNELGLGDGSLVLFVITQTTAVTVYSLLVGPIADRWGYRLTLRVLILGAAIAPAYALALPSFASGMGPSLFWLVFIPLGLTPLVPTILVNYTLELSSQADHPRYVSIVTLAMMPPHFLSPLVGYFVDRRGFAAVSMGTFVLMLACGLLTFWLDEPRQRPARGESQMTNDE